MRSKSEVDLGKISCKFELSEIPIQKDSRFGELERNSSFGGLGLDSSILERDPDSI